jgi:hypothetical protein
LVQYNVGPMPSQETRNQRRLAARKLAKRQPEGPAKTAAPGSAFMSWLKRHAALLCVLVVIAFAVAVRLRVADVPLERDEGEYAYAGQLILQGIPPYKLAYNMKFPGTYYAYSVILALFGQTPWGIHFGLLLINAATSLLLFHLARRLLGDSLGAAVAAVAFTVLSLDRGMMGVFAHATHFVLLPALAGFIALLNAIDSKKLNRFLIAGALLGLAVLMKQQAIFLLAFGMGLEVWREMRETPRDVRGMVLRSSLVALGSIVPFAVLSIALAAQGVLGKFWFWTFQYAKEYVSEIPLSDALANLISAGNDITQANSAIWILSGLGVLALCFKPWERRVRAFLFGFLAASFLAVCPGFYFRGHYFILLIPVAALMVGVAVISISRLLGQFLSSTIARTLALATFTGAVGLYVSNEREYLFSMPMPQLSRLIYGGNPFIEALEIARYIRDKTKPEDRIAILGSEPEIYFYADRKSATGYIYTYALMEKQKYAAQMQNEMIDEIEKEHPTYVVFVAVSTSWLARSREDKILTWSSRYLKQCYNVAGIADIVSQNETRMVWDAAAASYQPRANNIVFTFQRKSDAPCMVPR